MKVDNCKSTDSPLPGEQLKSRWVFCTLEAAVVGQWKFNPDSQPRGTHVRDHGDLAAAICSALLLSLNIEILDLFHSLISP